MKQLYFCLCCVAFLILSCDQPVVFSNGGDAETVDLSSYLTEEVPESNLKHVIKKDAAGKVFEEGFVNEKRQKTGLWIVYLDNKQGPHKVISYVNGLHHGPYFEFSQNGNLELQANYNQNKLHGFWAKYYVARLLEEAHYNMGYLDGTYKKYEQRRGQLQTSIDYKNGKYDGWYRAYDTESGKVTVEYQYSNGERIGGGIVTPNSPNEPK